MLRLPKTAAAILSRIEIENAQSLATRRANAAIRRDLLERRGECESRLAAALDQKRQGNLYREVHDGDTVTRVADDSAVTVERDEIASINTQLARLEARNARRTVTAVKLKSELDPSIKYADEIVTLSLRKNESKAQALARVRLAIEAKRAERKTVANASRSFDETRESVMASLRGLAARGVPDPRPVFHGRPMEWPKSRVPNPGSVGFEFVTDGLAVLAWLFQPELERKLDSLLKIYKTDDALSEVEQAARLEEIAVESMGLYREEAALVESLIAEGADAWHMPDRPAEAILGIRRA